MIRRAALVVLLLTWLGVATTVATAWGLSSMTEAMQETLGITWSVDDNGGHALGQRVTFSFDWSTAI